MKEHLHYENNGFTIQKNIHQNISSLVVGLHVIFFLDKVGKS